MTDSARSSIPVRLTGSGTDARGVLDGERITVLAGSRGRVTAVPSYAARYQELRQSLLTEGVLRSDGDSLIVTRDHTFEAPSTAAAVLMGRSANGWAEWRLSDGRAIDVLRRSADEQAEQALCRRWYEAHCRRLEADPAADAHAGAWQADFADSAAEAIAILSTLTATRDLTAFHESLKAWAAKPTTPGFNGFSGQMLVNQVVKRSESTAELADLFADVLTVPADDDEARRKLQRMVDHIEAVRVGAHPAPGHATFLLSYFWALQDHDTWPTQWTSAAAFLEFLTGHRLPTEPVTRYMTFLRLLRDLDPDFVRFEQVAAWWDEAKPVLLDAVLVDRCRFGLGAALHDDIRERNAEVLVAAAGHLAARLTDVVSASAGRSLRAVRSPRSWSSGQPRSDCWAEWRTSDDGPALRLWITHLGAYVGLLPGPADRALPLQPTLQVAGLEARGYELLDPTGAAQASEASDRVRTGTTLLGRHFPPERLRDLDVQREATVAAVDLQPLLDELARRATGRDSGTIAADPLAPHVEEFVRRTGYPTEADQQARAERARFAELLAPDAVALADPMTLRQIWTTGVYGGVGAQTALNSTFREALTDAVEYERVLETIRYLCWGEDDDPARLDAVLDRDGDRYVRGLGEIVAMKLLAICHPDRYVPVHKYAGPDGKLAMLAALGLPIPTGSRGEVQVRANDLIRDRLRPFFPGDTWAMARFCSWYRQRLAEPADTGARGDPLDALADELLVERSFLEDVVALLEDKRQVILYGPPGTGKTYLAQKLAEALAPEPSQRMLVQFHPSMSYEDFFEGYRPETAPDGQLSYRLTPGPLALLAERARRSPGRRHVMIIDEINRANLPRVLGELLFLLEYRDRQIPTLYRPDDPFELPSDLWFIGTMNTADRSIALVDAALRRRFHFVPIFPNHGAMQGLLDRWLTRHQEPAWVGELVAMVNEELTAELGGPHLQIGPSYFMMRNLSEAAVRRIWAYNIEPFIEDQFFGDPAQIDRFRFDNVLARYLQTAAVDSLEELDAARADDDALAASADVVVGDDVDLAPSD